MILAKTTCIPHPGQCKQLGVAKKSLILQILRYISFTAMHTYNAHVYMNFCCRNLKEKKKHFYPEQCTLM